MAAINVHVGTQAPQDREGESCALAGVLADEEPGKPAKRRQSGRACIPALSATHNGQTRMVFLRRSLEDLLQGKTYWVAEGRDIGKKGGEASELYLVIDPPFEQNDVPWMPAALKRMDAVALFGQAGKMACPTWDLPAGSPVIGGACPGATPGQSSVPLQIRKKGESAVGDPVRLRETICQICYAEGGQYQSPHVQLGEIIRYWWCREMMESADRRETWARIMVRAIHALQFPVERVIDPRTGKPILPMRVHSSGDFFSHAYARSWIEVCNRVPEVVFWAPTRTWAAPGWVDFWREAVKDLKHENLSLRPSAYHTDDFAPSRDRHPWPGDDFPFTSEGTTAIYRFSDKGQGADERYDWSCKTYAIIDEAHSCPKALAPDGQVGCRACWIRPDLRVNYTAH